MVETPGVGAKPVDLVGRPIAVVVVAVVETIFGAKEQRGNHKQPSQYSQYEFDIHGGKGDDKRIDVIGALVVSHLSKTAPEHTMKLCDQPERESVETIEPAWLGRSSLEVAPDLLGCRLVRRWADGRQLSATIVETEAYTEGDPACHAYRRETPRNRVMFGPPGYSYVYLIYGMYHCFNVVTDRDRTPSAVLIRAVEIDSVPPWLEGYRAEKPVRWGAGPGKLCRLLDIDRTLTDQPLTSATGLWLEPRSAQGLTSAITQTTRIGLTQGADLPWRWYVTASKAVSKL
jgi:DNA-3-methyladenine glycosylase